MTPTDLRRRAGRASLLRITLELDASCERDAELRAVLERAQGLLLAIEHELTERANAMAVGA